MLNFHLQKKLRHFTVEIEQQIGAETLVLIGHSGCGKSTTLNMLAGLLIPDHGHIELDEHTLWQENGIHLPPEQRRIGYLFQNYALFPHLSVADNIAYGLGGLTKTERDTRVAEALALLNLEPLANAKPASLSGGEQQRVALARAIVTRPKLLLLDEPLSALDVSLRSHVRNELKTLLKKLAIPTLIVTHDYEDARILADRIAVMHRGKIIQAGTPSSIAKTPATPFVAEFVGTNFLYVPHKKAGEELAEKEGQENQGAYVAEEHLSYIAFDPWRVTVTRQKTVQTAQIAQTAQTGVDTRLRWEGQIRDIAHLGGYVRFTLETVGEKEKQQLLADVSLEQLERLDHLGNPRQTEYQIGEIVYASIEQKDIRLVQTTPELLQLNTKSQQINAEATPYPKGKSRTAKWILPTTLLLILFLTGYALYHSMRRP